MWREATTDDLHAALSEDEASIFAASKDYFGDTHVEKEISNAVATVRGYIRSGRKCRMSGDETLLPDFLIVPTMDFAAFNLLKRQNIRVNESRTLAYNRANQLFDKLASGDIAPEDYGEDVSAIEPASSLAKASIKAKPRMLGRRAEEGI